jgi:hypothetical protein
MPEFSIDLQRPVHPQVLFVLQKLVTILVAWITVRLSLSNLPTLYVLAILSLLIGSMILVWHRYAFYILIAFIPFQYYAGLARSVTINLLEILIAIAFAIWIAQGFLTGKIAVPYSGLLLLVVLYGVFNSVLLITGPFDPESWKMVLRGFLFIMLCFITVTQITNWNQIWKILRIILVLSIPGAIFQYYLFFRYHTDHTSYLSLMQKLSELGLMAPSILQRDVMSWLSIYPTNRPGSTFDFGGGAYTIYLAPVILLAISLAWSSRRRSRRIALWILAIFLLGALFFTYSRTGLFSFAGGFLVMLWYSGRKKMVIAVLLIGVLLFLYAPYSSNYMLRRFTSQARDAYPLLEKRYYALRSLEIAFSSPSTLLVGGGMATFDKNVGGVLPHNGFLADFQSKGLFAFSISLAMFYLAFRKARFLIGRLHKQEKAVALWLMAGIVSYFLQMLATTPLQETQAAMMFWIMVSLVIAIGRLVSYREKAQDFVPSGEAISSTPA